MRISLLGYPSIANDGEPPRHVRGHKPWGLLAYLILHPTAPSRHAIAGLLFAEADDPLGALRSALAELRRALGPEATIGADPIRLDLPADAHVDCLALIDSDLRGGSATGLCGIEMFGDLLEAFDFGSSPSFDAWLVTTRSRMTLLVERVGLTRVDAALADGHSCEALAMAEKLVEINPLSEELQAQLIRCLIEDGHRDGARTQHRHAMALVRREFGTQPASLLENAFPSIEIGERSVAEAAIRVRLDVGRAAAAAGAITTAMAILSDAVEAAADVAPKLRSRAWVTLGTGMVRMGTPAGSAAPTLRHGLRLARAATDSTSMVVALRQLGFLDVQAGRHAGAESKLAEACDRARADPDLCASIGAVRAMGLSDQTRYDEADELLSGILGVCGSQNGMNAAFASSLLGRVHLLRGDFAQAEARLDDAERLARLSRWSAFLPWPVILRAQVDLATGRHELAVPRLAHALGCAGLIGDFGMQAYALAVMGVAIGPAEGVVEARRKLSDAQRLIADHPATYIWIRTTVERLRESVSGTSTIGRV